MRLLHLIPYMHPSAGGPPVVVDRWCVELPKLGCEVQVLTTDAYADHENDAAWVREFSDRYPIEVLAGKGPKGFGYSPAMKTALDKSLADVDLVHVHNLWGYTNQLAARVCSRRNVPFVVSTHGMLDPNSVGRKWLKKRLYGNLIEYPALRKATGMMFTHQEEERLARDQCSGLAPGHVVPLGTEEPPDLSKEVLAEKFVSQFPECRGKQLVTFLSRLHSKKGLDLLIPAMKTVLQSIPESRLVLVGPGEADYVRSLKQMCEANGIADAVLFTGSLAGIDKWAALAAADVYVLSSYQENFAIALVEALRVGSPVICSRRVNLWSDLQQADAATVCDLTPDSVSECIQELLTDRAKATAQAAAGSKYAQENYTWPRSAKTLLEAYRRVVG